MCGGVCVPRVPCLSEFELQGVAELGYRQAGSRILIQYHVTVEPSFRNHGGEDGVYDGSRRKHGLFPEAERVTSGTRDHGVR